MKTEDSSDYNWLLEKNNMKDIKGNKHPKAKLKVGDIVRVKSREWYEANKDSYGSVNVYCTFVPSMVEFCGNSYRIEEVFPNKKEGPIYHLADASGWEFSEDMFELE